MTDMREYAAQHGWEVGSHLRYAGGVGPSSVITSIEADEVRISTPGDFPGRLTGGSSSALEKWTLDWQYRAEKAEAAVQRARDAAVSIIAAVEDWQNNEHEAAMKELREWQRRAEVAEAEGQRLRGVLEETVYSWMQKAETLEAEVVNLSKELVLAKATIQRVRGVINEGRKHRGWGYDDDYDSGWDGCANDVERALVVVPDE